MVSTRYKYRRKFKNSKRKIWLLAIRISGEITSYGACEAGIDFIGVKYGFGFKNDEDLEKVKTCRVCKDIKELSSYFLNNWKRRN